MDKSRTTAYGFLHIKAGTRLTKALHLHKESRLLHSPSLVAVGLSVGYETWPPTGTHIICDDSDPNKGWGMPQFQGIVGSLDWWEILPFFLMPLTVPLHSTNSRQLPAVRAVQEDCETVYKEREAYVQGKCFFKAIANRDIQLFIQMHYLWNLTSYWLKLCCFIDRTKMAKCKIVSILVLMHCNYHSLALSLPQRHPGVHPIIKSLQLI